MILAIDVGNTNIVLGTIDLHISYNKPFLLRHETELPLDPFYAMDPSLLVLWLYPGITRDVVNAQLATPGIKAVVLRTFGAGKHLPKNGSSMRSRRPLSED